MDPFYTISDENPNEIHGVRACIFAGQQKHADCSGRWVSVNYPAVKVANPLAPRAAGCEYHFRQVVSDLDASDEAVRLGYAAPPAAQQRQRRSPAKRATKPPVGEVIAL